MQQELYVKPGHRHTGTVCTFRVCCAQAQQVKLVLQRDADGSQQILPLRERAPGRWELSLELAPGLYRFCYHLFNGRSLTYLTPSGWAMDGLKAVLRVPEPQAPVRRSGAVVPTDSAEAAVPAEAAALVEAVHPEPRRAAPALAETPRVE